MLVITRRPGESFAIGPDITVHVVQVRGEQVRIAIEAPRSIRIARDNIKKGEKE
jgi:carbon storage regulator